jgi:hypothetical protein
MVATLSSQAARALIGITCVAVFASTVRADEVWVPPTSQQDVGGLEVASNGFWPVTPIGAVRLAWAVPSTLQTFQSAKVVLIPGSPGGGANLNVFVCAAQNENPVAGNCAGPFAQPFTGVANQLVEVEIGAIIASRVGTAGANYLAVLAYTTPTTTTDHIVGLRFAYAAKTPSGLATLGANTFTGTQTAPAFLGNGSGLTGLPKLGANTFTGTQTAPKFVGDGSSLTNLPVPGGVATLGTNTFSGTQTAPNVNVTGKLGIGTTNPFGTLQIGNGVDSAFRFEPSDVTPNAGYIRFGDKTGWSLHFARSRESSGGPLNTGGTGTVMSLDDSGNLTMWAGELKVRVNDPFSQYISFSGRPALCGCFRATIKTPGPEIVFSIGGTDPAWIDSGGVFHTTSSRTAKERFRVLDLTDMLDRIERLPIVEWNYKSQNPGIRHIGPFAEDFHALFGLDGDDDKMISTVDPSGVALVGVKALAERMHAQEGEIAAQRELLNRQAAQIEVLKARIAPARTHHRHHKKKTPHSRRT